MRDEPQGFAAVTPQAQTAQQPLWVDSFEDAVGALARVVGGKKKLAAMLRPNKDPDDAATWLSDCLNPDRPHKFERDDYRNLFKIGREFSCHVVLYYFTDDAGYSRANPIEPEDERAALDREFIGAVDRLERLVARRSELESKRPKTK